MIPCLLESQSVQYVAAEVGNDFRELLNRLAARFPSRDAFAKALGMNNSRLSRALNQGDFPFNVANCLRLAKISGESPGDVLRAAGKSEVAELIEGLYGREAEYTAEERDVIKAWRALTPRARASLHTILDDLVPRAEKTPKRKAS